MALVNVTGVTLRNCNGEPLPDAVFRNIGTVEPLEYISIHNTNFRGLIPAPGANVRGTRVLLKMNKMRCQIFQTKLTNSRQYGIL